MAESKTKKTTAVKEPKAPKVAKTAVKAEKAVAKVEKSSSAKATEGQRKTVAKAHAGLTVDLFDTTGATAGTIELPAAIFGAKVNKELVAQAIRVYLVNQRQGNASTKTRGEVDGSTRKIYRQKGTGRARHGGIRAPLFVKGGIAHGPKPKDYTLNLSKKMRKAAFESALSSQLQNGAITVVTGVEKLAAKTKEFAGMFDKLHMPLKGRNVLFVMPKHVVATFKGARNLSGVEVVSAELVNTYQVLAHKKLVFMKEAIDTFAKEHTK